MVIRRALRNLDCLVQNTPLADFDSREKKSVKVYLDFEESKIALSFRMDFERRKRNECEGRVETKDLNGGWLAVMW